MILNDSLEKKSLVKEAIDVWEMIDAELIARDWATHTTSPLVLISLFEQAMISVRGQSMARKR